MCSRYGTLAVSEWTSVSICFQAAGLLGSSAVTGSSHPGPVSFLDTLPTSSSLLQSRVYSPVQSTPGLRRHTRVRTSVKMDGVDGF